MWPVIIGFVATFAFGGAAIAVYRSGMSSDDSRLAATSAANEAEPGNLSQPSGGVNRDNAANLAAAQLTSAVSAAVLQENAVRQQELEDKVLPFLSKHCNDCHNADTQEGGIFVHQLTTVDQLLKERKKWDKVYRMINVGAMPPSDYDPQPEDNERREVADILYSELYEFDCTLIHHAGRSTLHRLNRAEYNNTIRDLFGISLTPADKFPQDDVGEGFDNIGDVLSIPPLLMFSESTFPQRAAKAVSSADGVISYGIGLIKAARSLWPF